MRRSIVVAGVAVALTLGALVSLAGPLNPPAGPIAPTGKTLQEVEPRIAINAANTPGDATSLFKINQRGSYYLTGNITGVVGKHGIAIAVSGVTLDLNGFDLVGVGGMGAFDGVSVTANFLTNIAVINGSVRSWGDEGVDLQNFAAYNCRVEGVRASDNLGIGIATFDGCTVTNCSAFQNIGTGISTGGGGMVSNCSVSFTTGTGITVGSGSTITNCSAYNNTVNGINPGGGSTVSNCSAFLNAGSGIDAFTDSTVTKCSAYINTGNGINAAAGSTVSNCSAYNNTGTGISVAVGCSVTDCSAGSNTLDGIRCVYGCMIRGNTCANNGLGAGNGAGIHVTSNTNRIEGNNCTLADRGIDVDAPGNIIIKNTCSANTTSWDVVAGNVILVVNGVGAPAVLGTAGGAAPGSTDPNANFSY